MTEVDEKLIDSITLIIDKIMPTYLKDGTKNLLKAEIQHYVDKQTAEIKKDGKVTLQEMQDLFTKLVDDFKLNIKEVMVKISQAAGIDSKIAEGLSILLDPVVVDGLKELPKAFSKHVKGEKEVVVRYDKLIVGVFGLFLTGFWIAYFIFEMLT
jgi:hypothetical protein